MTNLNASLPIAMEMIGFSIPNGSISIPRKSSGYSNFPHPRPPTQKLSEIYHQNTFALFSSGRILPGRRDSLSFPLLISHTIQALHSAHFVWTQLLLQLFFQFQGQNWLSSFLIPPTTSRDHGSFIKNLPTGRPKEQPQKKYSFQNDLWYFCWPFLSFAPSNCTILCYSFPQSVVNSVSENQSRQRPLLEWDSSVYLPFRLLTSRTRLRKRGLCLSCWSDCTMYVFRSWRCGGWARWRSDCQTARRQCWCHGRRWSCPWFCWFSRYRLWGQFKIGFR